MAPTAPLPFPAAHRAFQHWANSRGCTSNSVRPALFPRSGLGIASTAPISGPQVSKADQRLGFTAGAVIAHTPISALLTRENVRKFAPRLPGEERTESLSTHAVLAAGIASEATNLDNEWRPWMDVWPTLEELKLCMPLLWSEDARNLLPPSARSLLEAQEKKFEKHWAAVQGLLGGDFVFDRDTYIWAWLVVNTRSLFYKLDTPEYQERTRDDCMALCPFIDYFNHSDEGCKVELSPAGYTVTTIAPVPAADTQLFVSYGCHSNDFLLIEYGFLLAENKWDEVAIDAYLLPSLSPPHRAHLDSEGFLGNYIFDRNNFCYRTQAAVRMLLVPVGTSLEPGLVASWRRFLSGEEEGERDQHRVDQFLRELLENVRREGKSSLEKVRTLKADASIGEAIEKRWRQIIKMANEVEQELDRKAEDAEDGAVPLRRYM